MQIDGRTLHYTVTVGTLPIKGRDGKPAGDVVFTAYTVEGKDRPVTFAMNGGPGASSVYLNLGAIGPKKVAFGTEGDSPSDPAILSDNPGTWLDFTDLVFIDPIGTGYSRSLVNEADTKKMFYSTGPDIEYLSRIVFDWLVKNGRMMSRKYFVGESYGGYRGPRITHYLQTQLGVALNGVVLVSPYLNPNQGANEDLSPLAWMMTLPSIAAAHQEREHALTQASMDAVIAYTRGDYAVALMRGRSDPQATQAMIQHVTEITGLDPIFVKRSGGRLETQAYLREVFRAEGKLGSRYDPNVTAPDPFPFDPDQRSNDPILESIIAPTTHRHGQLRHPRPSAGRPITATRRSPSTSTASGTRAARSSVAAPSKTSAKPSPPTPRCASSSSTAGTTSPAPSWDRSSPSTRCPS